MFPKQSILALALTLATAGNKVATALDTQITNMIEEGVHQFVGAPPSATMSGDSLSADVVKMVSQLESQLAISVPPVSDCSENMLKPVLSGCDDTTSTMQWYFDTINYNACQMGFNPNITMELSEMITAPLTELSNSCYQSAAVVEESPFCVERFEDGSAGGFLDPAADFETFKGGTNQYAWAANFNDDIGLGIVIHSTGSPGALTGFYSLPTFTVRDRDGNIVYEGIYADPAVEDVALNVGLRSGLVLDLDDDILSVLASTISTPNGEFYQFDLNLTAYEGTPLTGLKPSRVSAFSAPSVRAVRPVSDDLILYAPLFDVGGGTGVPFLKLFNWKTFETLDTDFILTNSTDDSQLEGLVWDFECADAGLCYINTVNTIDNNITIVGDEESVPTLGTFPLSMIEEFIASNFLGTMTDDVPESVSVPLSFLDPQFTVDYSAQSFEPLDETSSLVCTLSGFLFAIGIGGTEILGAIVNGEEDIALLELGQGQQCSVCNGVLPDSEKRRNLKKDKKKDDEEEDDEEEDDKKEDEKDDKEKKKKEKSKKKKKKKDDEIRFGLEPGTCKPVELQNQPLTTAYTWAIKECGGKIFVGTYDIASVFGQIIGDVLVERGAAQACENVGVQDQVCEATGVCTPETDPVTKAFICVQVVQLATSSFLEDSPSVELAFQAFLDTSIIGSPVSPEDFGFDLYYIEKEDLSLDNPQLIPVTQNGFRELSPSLGVDEFASTVGIDFDPTKQADPAIRNMVCHKDPTTGVEKLIVGSAVFKPGFVSNTYIVDPGCTLIL